MTFFKILLNIHEEYSQVLDDDERAGEDDWFDDLDNRVYTFKRKIHNWLRNAETERRSSKGSSRRIESGQSKSSGRSRKSQSSCAREPEMKGRIAEVMAEAEYIEQRQYAKIKQRCCKFNRRLLRAKQGQKFMASMIQNLLMMIEVSFQMTK